MASFVLDQYLLGGIASRSCVVLLLTAGVAFALRHRSASVVHGIWAVGLGGCLAIPVIMSISPGWSLPLLPPAASADLTTPDLVPRSQPATAPSIAAHAPLGRGRAMSGDPTTTNQSAAATSPATVYVHREGETSSSSLITSQFDWPLLVTGAMAIWAAGFFALLLRILQQTIAVHRRVNKARDVHGTEWCDQRDSATQVLGLRVNVVLKRSSEAISPMVVGLFKPVVLLPVDADTWSKERRRLVLLHELAHVQRHDVLTQTIAALACAVYWFNPLAWWGASQMKRLREIACDDAVVIHSTVPATYAQTLLDVAKGYRYQHLTGAVAMARSSNVESRIAAILSSTRSRAVLTNNAVRCFAAAALVVVTFVGTCQLSSRADDTTEQKSDHGGNATQKAPESRAMAVRVLDESGRPLSGANVHVSIWEMQGPMKYLNRNYTTDDDGRAEIAMPRRLRIMRLWPAKDGYVPLFVNFAEGKHEEGRLIPDDYEFRLEKGHRLSGRVVDVAGNPISNATVEVRVKVDEPAWGADPDPMISSWLTDSDFNGPAPVTDSDGRWSIDNAPAPPKQGKDYEFRLRVTHHDFAGDTRWGELQQQQGITTAGLRTGNATLTLGRGLVTSGDVGGPEGQPITKGWVVWNDEPYFTSGTWETRIDEEGHFRMPPLPAGEYPITVIAPGYAAERRVVTAKAGMEEMRFKLKPGNRIVIRFVDVEGVPVPGAGVYLGASSGANTWNNTNALHNQTGSNVPNYGIPRKANDQGVYVWDWAPEGAVTYQVGAKGFAPQTLSLVPKSEPHVVTLAPQRVVVGKVTDASTGKPIERFLAMPVIVFRTDFYHARTTDAKVGHDGRYELPLTGSGDPTDRYRVRFEAEGYRSVVSEESFGPLDGRATLDFAMQPAPARRGRVVDAEGRPVENATVLQASPTEIPDTSNGKPDSWDSRPIPTDAQGSFQLQATTEPVRVRAYHDLGFAEKTLEPNEEEIGVMKLEPWAMVSGRLVQEGRPVADQEIYFYPLVNRGLTEPRFQDSFYAKTDANGHFEFERIPPIGGALRADLGPWRDSSLTSSESIPVELRPGEHRQVMLGGEGATITGRVIAIGRSNESLSKKWSLNYLISRDRGVTYHGEAKPPSFDPSGPLKTAWLRQPNFQAWFATRVFHFVKLSEDGRLRINSVQPGEYDFVIQLYEQPAGCLVETVGEKVVPVTVTADDAAAGQVDIGDVKVKCRVGPRVGSDMRGFKFTDAGGRVRSVDDMKGRYVLLHVWATWCEPCIASMPMLKATVEQYSKSPLTVVGFNIDDDVDEAKAVADAQGMDWRRTIWGRTPTSCGNWR